MFSIGKKYGLFILLVVWSTFWTLLFPDALYFTLIAFHEIAWEKFTYRFLWWDSVEFFVSFNWSCWVGFEEFKLGMMDVEWILTLNKWDSLGNCLEKVWMDKFVEYDSKSPYSTIE